MIQYDSIDESFDIAAKRVFELECVSDENKLKLYGLFKQATIGNNKTSQPSVLDFKGNAKWKAWKQQSGKGKLRAKTEYIAFVDRLQKEKID